MLIYHYCYIVFIDVWFIRDYTYIYLPLIVYLYNSSMPKIIVVLLLLLLF